MLTTPTRAEHLTELLRAFGSGGTLPPELADAASGGLFDRHIQQHVALLPLVEKLTVQRASSLSQAGLLAARQGELLTARQLLDESISTAQKLPTGRAAWAFCRSTTDAAVAYSHYRDGQHDAAVKAVREANAADLLLIERYGVAVMHMHRVQQAHNLARIEHRRGRVDRAVFFAEQLLAHLADTDDILLPLDGPWRNELCSSCPVELVAAMYHQIDAERCRWIVA